MEEIDFTQFVFKFNKEIAKRAKNNECTMCKCVIDDCTFDTDKYIEEYMRLGLCPTCQDWIFGKSSHIENKINMKNKYVKIQHFGTPSTDKIFSTSVLEITEKLDGSNMSFYIDDQNVLIPRSKNRELIGSDQNDKLWSRAITLVMEAHKNNPFPTGKIFFGESMCQKHTINYGKIEPFVGFSVLDLNSHEYEKNWATYYKERDIPHVQAVIVDHPTTEFIEEILNKKSDWGTEDIIREGIVLKNYEDQIFAKIVRDKFKEKHRRKPVPAIDGDDSGKIVNRFCTDARIRKQIFKMQDDGEILDMPMMVNLPRNVLMDIIDEEAEEIFSNYHTIKPRYLTKNIAKLCVPVLKEMVMNRGLIE